MATTANGLPYPVGTDHVIDGDDAIKALAEKLDLLMLRTWTPYTPTFVNLTLGNGTALARYWKLGRFVHTSGLITLGSTTVMNTNPVTISLPFIAGTALPLGHGIAQDVSANLMLPGAAVIFDPNTFLLRMANGSPLTVNNPFTFAPPDTIGWSFSYETTAAAAQQPA